MDGEANDRDGISKTPDLTKHKEGARIRETVSTCSLSFSNSDGKILPRYLRPSTGSCHDFCKYGKKEISEAAVKHPFLCRSLSTKIIRGKEQNQLESSSLGEARKKHPFLWRSISSRISQDKEQNQMESLNLGERRKKHPLLCRSMSSKIFIDEEQNQMENSNLGVRRKKHPLLCRSMSSKIIQNQEQNQLERLNLGERRKKELIMKKDKNEVEHNVIKQKTPPLVNKSIQSAQLQALKRKASSPLKRIDLPGKTVISLKRKINVIKPVFVLSHLRTLPGRMNQETKMGVSRIREEKVLKPPSASLSPKTPLDSAVSMTPRKYKKSKHAFTTKKSGDDIKQKVLTATDAKLDNIEFDLIQIKEKTIGIEIPKGEERRRHRRTASVESLTKPHKLRFERGKVVDLRPEVNGTRRLRFGKGRVMGENPNGNGEVRNGIVKKAESSGLVSSNYGSESHVLLRHHDAQGKKDPQGLLNHVIEETATMLVGTRKSKVKALVGAFETVISLQESKEVVN